jgi:hypothetical protein
MNIPTHTAALIIHELLSKNLIPRFDLIDDPNGDYAKHADLRGLDGQWAEAQALVNFSQLTPAERADALTPSFDADMLRDLISGNAINVDRQFDQPVHAQVKFVIEASGLPFEKPTICSGQGDKGMSTIGELLNDRSNG